MSLRRHGLFSAHRYLLSVLVLVTLATATAGNAQTKKRIAVMGFDDRQITSADSKATNVGIRLSDAVIAKLSGLGTFDLVDHQFIESAIIKEQDKKLDPRYDPVGAARIGKLANVSALIMGKVSAFNASVSSESSGMVVMKSVKQIGHIELSATAQFINVETGIVSAAISKSIPTRNETLNAVKQVGGFSTGSSTGDAQTLLSKLVDKSIDELAGLLADEIVKRIPDLPVPVSTVNVLGMDGGALFIDKGEKDGVRVGAEYAITRSVVSATLIGADGKPVSRLMKVCTLSIGLVEGNMSSGKCTGELAKSGDIATRVDNAK